MSNQPTSPVASTPKSVTPELQKGIDKPYGYILGELD